MLAEDLYFKRLSDEELWKRYCGFLELSGQEFLEIQRSLLEEQLALVSASLLGRKILGQHPPRSVEEFRATAPFTTYDDYEPYLSEKREETFGARPLTWCHSSGRGGKFKWMPHSEALMEKTARNCVAIFILASASRRGEINLKPGLRVLTALPPVPYASGTLFAHLRKRFTFHPIPSPESVKNLPFVEQVSRAFELSLRDGFDVAGAVASVLVRMGKQLSAQKEGPQRLPAAALHPKALMRLLRGLARSRREHRGIYPKDLWNAKGIMSGGVDSSIYRAEVEKYWGVPPFDVYACAEAMLLGMQGWNKKHMTFLPDSAFLEFIPHEPQAQSGRAPGMTLLMDQLEAGRLYEVVLTQLHGMPLLRYRLGDVIQVHSIGDPEAGFALPQIEVRRRLEDVIHLAGLCTLDERTLWMAMAGTGLQYTEWTAFKEYDGSATFLRLIVELKEARPAAEVSALLDEQLKRVDTDYVDIERYLGFNPIRTTLVSEGTFKRYLEARVRESAELANLRPKHLEPSRQVLAELLKLGEVVDKE